MAVWPAVLLLPQLGPDRLDKLSAFNRKKTQMEVIPVASMEYGNDNCIKSQVT